MIVSVENFTKYQRYRGKSYFKPMFAGAFCGGSHHCDLPVTQENLLKLLAKKWPKAFESMYGKHKNSIERSMIVVKPQVLIPINGELGIVIVVWLVRNLVWKNFKS